MTETLRPSPDLQSHLAVLEQKGLLVRIDEPINKDTELHPLVRWQFQGGLAEEQRRAFLFTNVVDASGHRYDIPVVVGALGASRRASTRSAWDGRSRRSRPPGAMPSRIRSRRCASTRRPARRW